MTSCSLSEIAEINTLRQELAAMRLATTGAPQTVVLSGIGPKIVLVQELVPEVLILCPEFLLLHHKASWIPMFPILGRGLPYVRNGSTMTNVDSGGSIKGMSVVFPRPELILFGTRILGIHLYLLGCRTDSMTTHCTFENFHRWMAGPE